MPFITPIFGLIIIAFKELRAANCASTLSYLLKAEARSLKLRNTTSMTRTNINIIVAYTTFPLCLDVEKFTLL